METDGLDVGQLKKRKHIFEKFSWNFYLFKVTISIMIVSENVIVSQLLYSFSISAYFRGQNLAHKWSNLPLLDIHLLLGPFRIFCLEKIKLNEIKWLKYNRLRYIQIK